MEFKLRKRDKFGNIILSEDGIIDLLYSDQVDLFDIEAEDCVDVRLFNKWANMFDEALLPIYIESSKSIEEYDQLNQSIWFIPEEYKEIDLEKYLYNKCRTTEEKDRVKEELVLFRERDMEIILRVLIYLIDIMRKNKIVWGVGRGSSCSSLILYLIGVHKVDPLKYKLDIKEFLK